MAPEFPTLLARLGQIPNVAHYAVRGSVDYVAPVGDEDFRLNGWAHYVGPSRLGIGPILGEGQGDYLDTGLAMRRSEEHTSELQSLMRISYAVFCLKKKK